MWSTDCRCSRHGRRPCSTSAPLAVEAAPALGVAAAGGAAAASVPRLQSEAPPPRGHLNGGEENDGDLGGTLQEMEAEHRAAVAIKRRVRGYLSRRESKVSAVRAVSAFSRLVS